MGINTDVNHITAQSLTLPNATVQFTNNVNDLGTYLHSASPASFSSVSSGRSNSHCRLRQRRHLFMRLSAANSTIATVC